MCPSGDCGGHWLVWLSLPMCPSGDCGVGTCGVFVCWRSAVSVEFMSSHSHPSQQALLDRRWRDVGTDGDVPISPQQCLQRGSLMCVRWVVLWYRVPSLIGVWGMSYLQLTYVPDKNCYRVSSESYYDNVVLSGARFNTVILWSILWTRTIGAIQCRACQGIGQNWKHATFDSGFYNCSEVWQISRLHCGWDCLLNSK